MLERAEPLKSVAIGGSLNDGDWVESKDQNPDGSIRLVQLADIADGHYRQRSDRWIDESAARRLDVHFLQPNDLLIARMPDPLGRCCEVPPRIGRAVTVVDVAVLRITDPRIVPRYVMYALNSPGPRTSIAREAKGATRQRIGRKQLGRTRIPLPTTEVQRSIALYLDHAEIRIMRAAESKRALIDRLDERRRAVAQAVIAGGIAPASSSKSSGIEWLGDVPSHWAIRPAKFLFREVDERSKRGDEQLMSVSHITGVTTRASKNVTMFQAADYSGHKLCRPGDVVINTMWAWMGALGVAREAGIVSPAYGVYRPLADSSLTPDYADVLLRTQPYIDEYTCRSTGIRSSRLRLYADRFLRIPVLCPPIEEQHAIVASVREATEATGAAIAAVAREVELLEEYRTRLISDVVTGRLDVRAEAALLPDIDPEELDLLTSGLKQEFDEEES